MSSNKPKDEADRLVEALVRVERPNTINNYIYVGSVKVATRNYVESQADDLAREIRGEVAAAIREAIEVRDRIMTDLLSESEAFCEGWRQGAAAQREEDCKKLRSNGWNQPRLYIDKDLVRPPSHNDSGKSLAPSPVHMRARRMERALLEIVGDPIVRQDPSEMRRIASEALEEFTNG